MRIHCLIISLVLGITCASYAQNFQYEYQMIRLTSQYDSKTDPKLQKYVNRQKARLDREMNVVVGYCDETLSSFVPASPLSNFLTDLLLEKSPDYVSDTLFSQCDLSLLNFGGIRSQMLAGNVTVGDIFSISPFDNYLTFIEIKGSELKKMFGRFREKIDNAPFSGAQLTFSAGWPSRILVQGKPLETDRVYRLVTLNFIADGGDNILRDIQFEKKIVTNVVFRDFLIDEIKAMTQEGRHIEGKMDDRVVITPTP